MFYYFLYIVFEPIFLILFFLFAIVFCWFLSAVCVPFCISMPYLTYSNYILSLHILIKVWPFSVWVPARQQVEGSTARRDYLVLSLYFLFFFIEVELWLTRLEFVSWRWCCLVFDFFILDGSYVTLLPWPVFTLICLGSNLITWKTLFFSVFFLTASRPGPINFLTTFKPFDLYCNLLAVIHHNWVIRINFYHCLVKYLKYTCFSYFVISVLRLSMNTTSRQLNTKSTIGKIKVVLD